MTPGQLTTLVVVLLLAAFVLTTLARTVRVVPQATAVIVERLGRYSRTLEPGLHFLLPVHRPGPRHRRPARAGGQLPAATGDHLGQPRRQHRLGHLLPDRPTQGGRLRDRQLHPGHRAADRHHSAQRDRLARPRADPDQPRQHQRPAARSARRGHRQVGDPGQPGRAQGDRPAAQRAGLDGEADARRAGPAGGDPDGRGRQAVADPHGRGRQAVRDPAGPGPGPGRGPEGRR